MKIVFTEFKRNRMRLDGRWWRRQMLNRQRGKNKEEFLSHPKFLLLLLMKIVFTEFRRKRMRLDWRWWRRQMRNWGQRRHISVMDAVSSSE